MAGFPAGPEIRTLGAGGLCGSQEAGGRRGKWEKLIIGLEDIGVSAPGKGAPSHWGTLEEAGQRSGAISP